METISINVDASQIIRPFNHFYRAVGYANVDYTYTRPFRKMYDYLSSFHNHPRYMRLHNILTAHGRGDYYLLHEGSDYGNPRDRTTHFDNVVTLDASGKLTFNWDVVNRVYDILVEHNIKPIVETHHVPTCLVRPDSSDFAHEPPQDFRQWGEVIQTFTAHVVDRYGLDEVKQWYFEIWNEPDNSLAFRGDPRLFMALYDYMEHGIHSVDPSLKVGGPATKQAEEAFMIFEAFLKHCAHEPNYVTGQIGTRVDFISVHCKGGRPPHVNCPSTRIMFNSLRDYLDILKAYPEFRGVEFINDESDVVWAGNRGIKDFNWMNFRNTHYFPGFVCKMVNMYCDVVEDEYDANLTIVDSDNCHLQWERYLFSGNRSQFTPLVEYPSTDLITKPAFNAYVMLGRLLDQRLAVRCGTDGFGEKFGVLATSDDESIAFMAWNFEDGMDEEVNARRINVTVANLPFSGDYHLIHYRIDATHSNAYAAWKAIGKPAQPSIEQIKTLREREGLALFEPVKAIHLEGEFSANLDLPMHAVSLLLLVPHNTSPPATPDWIKGEAERGFNGNPQIFLKWRANTEKDFLHYQLWRQQDDSGFDLLADEFNIGVFTDMHVSGGSAYTYKLQAVNASGQQSDFSAALRVAVTQE